MSEVRLRRSLSYQISRLASQMFAGPTGFSGPELHDLFSEYTDVLGRYGEQPTPSRWAIFETGLAALTRDQQHQLLLELCDYDGPSKYGPPSAEDVAKLRSLLAADSTPGAAAAGVRLGELKDWDGVRRAWDDALRKVDRDPEGAITAARTTLESVCKHICDERGMSYDEGADLSRLYKTAARALQVAPDQYTEQIIKQILSGAATVVDGLAGLRNSLSDAHGRGKKAARPAPRHAKLAVNAAFAVAGFLIDSHVEKPLAT